MSYPLDELLAGVAEEIFEELAFMLIMFEDEAVGIEGEARTASVAFAGAFQGRLVVSVSEQMLGELARNMLGLDEQADPSLDRQQDALKELANVICGNLLPGIAGSEAEFDVGSPSLEVSEFPGEVPSGQQQVAQAQLLFDSGEAKLVLFLDNAAVSNNAVLSSGSSQVSE